MRSSTLAAVVLLGTFAFGAQANAHICEGTFTFTNVQILRQSSDIDPAPGQSDASVCPKNLVVILSKRPEGTILSGVAPSADYGGSSQKLIEEDLQSDESTDDLSNSVGNGMILATDVHSMRISGTLNDSGGTSEMAFGIPFMGRHSAFNSIQCDSSGLKLENRYSDADNDYDLVCTYARGIQ